MGGYCFEKWSDKYRSGFLHFQDHKKAWRLTAFFVVYISLLEGLVVLKGLGFLLLLMLLCLLSLHCQLVPILFCWFDQGMKLSLLPWNPFQEGITNCSRTILDYFWQFVQLFQHPFVAVQPCQNLNCCFLSGCHAFQLVGENTWATGDFIKLWCWGYGLKSMKPCGGFESTFLCKSKRLYQGVNESCILGLLHTYQFSAIAIQKVFFLWKLENLQLYEYYWVFLLFQVQLWLYITSAGMKR